MRLASLLAIVALGGAACGDGDGISRLVGARCDTATDCDERCLAPSNDFPEGFCTADCQTSSECPDDTECADKEGGVCLFTCIVTADCAFLGPAWTCREQNLRADQNVKVNVCMGD